MITDLHLDAQIAKLEAELQGYWREIEDLPPNSEHEELLFDIAISTRELLQAARAEKQSAI